MVELMAIKPREILGLDQVQAKAGSVADLTVFDASATWTVGEDGYESRARTPVSPAALPYRSCHRCVCRR